jgi:hypothetical protein
MISPRVQHVPLRYPPAGDPRVLANAPAAVLLAILRATLQRKNMMAADYRHIGGLENRLVRDYRRFSTSGPKAPTRMSYGTAPSRSTTRFDA